MDTDFFGLRYFICGLYIAVNLIPHAVVENMQMLLGDNLLLVQISSMLLYNQVSL